MSSASDLDGGDKAENALGKLSSRFLDFIQSQPPGSSIDLTVAADAMGVQKRRIYDITNVLDGCGLIAKSGKNSITWLGSGGAERDTAGREERIRRLRETIAEKDAECEALDGIIASLGSEMESLMSDPEYAPLAYVTPTDLQSLGLSRGHTVLAIHTQPGALLHVLDPNCAPSSDGPRFEMEVRDDRPGHTVAVTLVSRVGAIVNEHDAAAIDAHLATAGGGDSGSGLRTLTEAVAHAVPSTTVMGMSLPAPLLHAAMPGGGGDGADGEMDLATLLHRAIVNMQANDAYTYQPTIPTIAGSGTRRRGGGVADAGGRRGSRSSRPLGEEDDEEGHSMEEEGYEDEPDEARDDGDQAYRGRGRAAASSGGRGGRAVGGSHSSHAIAATAATRTSGRPAKRARRHGSGVSGMDAGEGEGPVWDDVNVDEVEGGGSYGRVAGLAAGARRASVRGRLKGKRGGRRDGGATAPAPTTTTTLADEEDEDDAGMGLGLDGAMHGTGYYDHTIGGEVGEEEEEEEAEEAEEGRFGGVGDMDGSEGDDDDLLGGARNHGGQALGSVDKRAR